MLTDPKFAKLDAHMEMVLSSIGGGKASAERVEEGIYLIQHFGFDHMIEECVVDKYPQLDKEYTYNSYGVCDSIEQFKAHSIFTVLTESEKKYCVSFTHISKKEQPNSGGWRWHKWGPYIGNHEHECEYLYDEDGFEDGVYVYNIIEIRPRMIEVEYIYNDG